jgi:hypothetical protein
MIYAATRKRKDPDTPDYALAMSGVDKEEYLEVMNREITELNAPTVRWSTICLLLTMTLANEWDTRQVDYTNTFAQADIKETVFVELPSNFAVSEPGDYVSQLKKSLYGFKQTTQDVLCSFAHRVDRADSNNPQSTPVSS